MNIEVFNKIGRFQNKSIKHINIYAMVLAGIFAFVAAFVVIFNEYLDFNKEIVSIEKEYIKSQKRIVMQRVMLLEKIMEYNYQNIDDKDKLTKNIKDMVSKILTDDNKMTFFIFSSSKKVFVSKNFKYENQIKKILPKIKKDNMVFLKFGAQKKNYLFFVKRFERLDWIYGCGICVNDIQGVIEQKRVIYKNKISGFILKIVSLTFILYIFSILKYRFFTDKVSKELQYITDSFEEASSSYKSINIKKLEFDEFRKIAIHANDMIDRIKKKNSALIELNANLENLVAQKTKELQKSIAYTKELLEYQDKFVKNAIHEINTPLSIILMNVELYNMKYEKNSYLLKIEAAVKVLENIYGDLGYIVKKDRVEYEKHMIDFSLFLRERVEYFKDVASGNELELKTDIEEGLYILFNDVQLQRLCDNNISNAIKYSYPNETVFIELYRGEGCIILKISNVGDEIKNSEKLFERFYREDNAKGGFGLGLNIVKGICESNKVKIDVKSDKKITVFSYYFECRKEK